MKGFHYVYILVSEENHEMHAATEAGHVLSSLCECSESRLRKELRTRINCTTTGVITAFYVVRALLSRVLSRQSSAGTKPEAGRAPIHDIHHGNPASKDSDKESARSDEMESSMRVSLATVCVLRLLQKVSLAMLFDRLFGAVSGMLLLPKWNSDCVSR